MSENKSQKETKDVVGLRKDIRSKRPSFKRQDSHKKKRLNSGWRKPRGVHSKQRHKMKSRYALISQGVRSPRIIRGADQDGIIPDVILNIKNIEEKIKEGGVYMISGTLGLKKTLVVANEAIKKNATIVNMKNPGKVIDDYAKKKEQAKEIKKKKEESKKKPVKKNIKEKSIEDKIGKEEPDKEKKETNADLTEDKKTQETRKVEKILTKKS